jgi:hypothetical protein
MLLKHYPLLNEQMKQAKQSLWGNGKWAASVKVKTLRAPESLDPGTRFSLR